MEAGKGSSLQSSRDPWETGVLVSKVVAAIRVESPGAVRYLMVVPMFGVYYHRILEQYVSGGPGMARTEVSSLGPIIARSGSGAAPLESPRAW